MEKTYVLETLIEILQQLDTMDEVGENFEENIVAAFLARDARRAPAAPERETMPHPEPNGGAIPR